MKVRTKTGLDVGDAGDRLRRTSPAQERRDSALLDDLQRILDDNGSLVIDKRLDPGVKSVRQAIARFARAYDKEAG